MELEFDEVARLLDPEPMPLEMGIERGRDGVLHVAVRTLMADCNGEMFRWRFGWGPKTREYAWWHPGDHGSSEWLDLPSDGSGIGSTHVVDKRLGGDELHPLRIRFHDPIELFDDASRTSSGSASSSTRTPSGSTWRASCRRRTSPSGATRRPHPPHGRRRQGRAGGARPPQAARALRALDVDLPATMPRASVEAMREDLADVGERRLAAMDAAGIELAVLSSVASVQGAGLAAGEALRLARMANDALAETLRERPDRYAGFALVPLQDAATRADELERAVRELGLRGAMIVGHTDGRYLDDDRFTPL